MNESDKHVRCHRATHIFYICGWFFVYIFSWPMRVDTCGWVITFFLCVCVFFILFHCYCCYSYQVVCSYLCTALRGCTNVQTRFVCSIYLSFYPSIHPSIHPSVHLSIYLSMSVSVVSCQHGNCTHRMYSVRVHARGNIS